MKKIRRIDEEEEGSEGLRVMSRTRRSKPPAVAASPLGALRLASPRREGHHSAVRDLSTVATMKVAREGKHDDRRRQRRRRHGSWAVRSRSGGFVERSVAATVARSWLFDGGATLLSFQSFFFLFSICSDIFFRKYYILIVCGRSYFALVLLHYF